MPSDTSVTIGTFAVEPALGAQARFFPESGFVGQACREDRELGVGWNMPSGFEPPDAL